MAEIGVSLTADGLEADVPVVAVIGATAGTPCEGGGYGSYRHTSRGNLPVHGDWNFGGNGGGVKGIGAMLGGVRRAEGEAKGAVSRAAGSMLKERALGFENFTAVDCCNASPAMQLHSPFLLEGPGR